MHVKKHKGDVGLVNAIAELTQQEIAVALPISDHLKYDLVAERNGILKRVQVRYTRLSDGKMNVKLKSVWSNQAGVHVSRRRQGDFDILAVYCPETHKTYFVADDSFDCGSTMTLRVEPSKGVGGSGEVRMAENFVDCRKLFKEECQSG